MYDVRWAIRFVTSRQPKHRTSYIVHRTSNHDSWGTLSAVKAIRHPNHQDGRWNAQQNIEQCHCQTGCTFRNISCSQLQSCMQRQIGQGFSEQAQDGRRGTGWDLALDWDDSRNRHVSFKSAGQSASRMRRAPKDNDQFSENNEKETTRRYLRIANNK